MGAILKGAIVLTAWICVTVICALILWITQRLDIWIAIFILLLYGGPTALTIGYGLFERK